MPQDLSPELEAFQTWYFQEMDRRPDDDHDPYWETVYILGQMYGLCLNGGIACFYIDHVYDGDKRDPTTRRIQADHHISADIVRLRAVGLDHLADLMDPFLQHRDPEPFDHHFFRHQTEIFAACHRYAVRHDLYPTTSET